MRFKKLALLHDFDDNVAVLATTVASITTGLSSFRQNNARGGSCFKLGFGLRAGRVQGESASGGSGRGSGACSRAFNNAKFSE